MQVLASSVLRMDANWVDYLLVAIYFVFVLGIGLLARAQVSSSIDFFLSGRSLPAWVTGLAFISANLGAVEIMGMSANGAQFGMATFHYYWIGAIPAMLFLGVVMMPFYYGSKVRSVPEFMLRRFGPTAHLVNSISFAVAQILIAGVNLYLLATIVNALLGWNIWLSTVVAAIIVLSYITLGGLSAAIYNEVLQFFVIVAALLPLTYLALHKIGGWGGLQDAMDKAGTGNQIEVVARHRPDRLLVVVLVRRRHRLRPRVRPLVRLLDDELRRGAAGDGVQGHELRPAGAHHRLVPEDVHPVHHHRPRHAGRDPGLAAVRHEGQGRRHR